MIYIILDHRHEADQLHWRVYYESQDDANRIADELRELFDCPPAAIEVVSLWKSVSWPQINLTNPKYEV